MEHSLSSLTFKGSVTEAIIEAKRQKKLFVVCLSGEDTESSRLEKSTWTDSNVAESLSKYCVLLHIPEGSTDATHFSAIYPQKSVPCITAIGYNGVQVWQNEGFVSAEVLVSSLEKAWMSLHIQETTATFLTAALASRNSGASTSVSNVASSDQGSSSSTIVPSPSTDKHVQSEAKPVFTSEEEKKDDEFIVKEEKTELDDKISSRSNDASESKSVVDERPTSSTEVAKGLLGPKSRSTDKHVQSEAKPVVTSEEEKNGDKCLVKEKKTELRSNDASESKSVADEWPTLSTEVAKGLLGPKLGDLENSRPDHASSSAEDGSPAPGKIIDQYSSVPGRGADLIDIEVNEAEQDEKDEVVDNKKTEALDNCMRFNTSSDVQLNIRLPTGVCLQEKFSVTSTLRMVKDYVDENQASEFGSYDLAIPYPRKVFCGQDLSKSLSELGLFNRQALIVVPRQKATGYQRGGSSLSDQTNSTSNGGYFAYVRGILSYMNPFSYLGGGASSSSSRQESQHSPNPTFQNNFAGTERPHSRYPPNQNTSATGSDEGKTRQPKTASRFGSNIHTLKHDEDDDRFNDRNSYWNGNSTQYGGDNDGK